MTQTPAERRAARLEAWRRWYARNGDKKRIAVARARERESTTLDVPAMTEAQRKRADRSAARRKDRERAGGWRGL